MSSRTTPPGHGGTRRLSRLATSGRAAALVWAPVVLAPLALAAGAGCGSSTGATTSATSIDGGQSTDGGQGGTPEGGGPLASDAGLGAPCSQASLSTCASHECLVFGDSGAGFCSASCSTAAECGSAGACIPAGTDGGVCYRTCASGSDCSGDIPCIWYASIDAGLCEPLPASLCGGLAAQGACQACLGQQCCYSISACVEDVGCNQLESACAGNASCANMLEGSANAAAKALGTCAVDHCAAACQ